MDNGLPSLAAGKRRREGYSIEEDVQDNLKASRQWYGSQRADDVIKDGYQNNVHYQGLSMENLIRMQQQQQQQQQMSEAAATAPAVSTLNMQQRVMAAAALQDLRGITETSKVFFQPQLQQHMKYGIQQQQPQLQQQVSKTEACSLGELSSNCQPPQSPLPLPPAPYIRTPPLHSEADVHNGSPTSSSSGPYPNLPNMAGPPRTSQPCSAPVQLPEPEGDSSYSSLLHPSQTSLLAKNVQSGLLQTQQSTHTSPSVMSTQQLRGHSPQSGMTQQPDQSCRASAVHSNGPPSCLDAEISRQQAGQAPQNSGLQPLGSHGVPSCTQGSLQNGNVHLQNGHPSPNLLQNGMQNGVAFQHCGHTLPANALPNGMQNGSIQQQGGQVLQNECIQPQGGQLLQNGSIQQQGGQVLQTVMSTASYSGNHLPQGDSPRVGAASLHQQGRHTMSSSAHHQQGVHPSQSGLPNGGHLGMMHQQGGHRMQDGMIQHQSGHMSQTSMAPQNPGHCTSNGAISHQSVQGCSGGMPQQQMGFPPPLLRDIQGMQQVPNSWYPSIRDTTTISETQPSVSTLRLQRHADVVFSPLSNTMFSPSVTDLGSQRGLTTTALPQLSQVQGGFRDVLSDQDLHPQCEGQTLLQAYGPVKGCASPSNRTGKVLPVQTDLHGRRFLQGNSFCAPSSSGADMNLRSPGLIPNGGLDDPALLQRAFICPPPKFIRSFTKVYKLGSITRAVDVNRFSNYTELRCELARMFNLDGQLDQKLGWQLVFTDNEDDLLLVGDDPWEEFVRNVRGIRILTPAEVYYYTNEDKCTGAAYNSTGGSVPKPL